jgi:hypothetical protein
MADAHATESNFFLDHPGVVATLFAIVVAAGFIGAIYTNVTGHHEEHGAAGAEHGAAPGEKPAGEGAH